jgi:hypothetical protein
VRPLRVYDARETMQITLSRARLRAGLFVTWLVVVGAGLTVELLKPVFELSSRTGAVPMFSLSYEQNIPTWYSSALLFTCALLLAAKSAGARASGDRFTHHWVALALAFLYISLDETAELHEHASDFFQLDGVLYFGWVIPASFIVLAFGTAYLRFLWHLPKRTRVQFLVAGVIYVGGALGMELPLGLWTDRHGSKNLVYALLDVVEESMEMLGLNLFLLSLVDTLATDGITIGFARSDAAAPATTVGAPPADASEDA